jgi:phosphatidylglycerol---prolipoprotein diacylglyceryl transferase
MIHWNVGPEIFSIGPLTLRWYGLLFAVAFYLGYRVVRYFFVREGYPVMQVDRLLIWVILGTVLGARLGHTLFYEPDVYLHDPFRILMIWEGGLASHGGTLGVVLALFVYSRRHRLSYAWLLDRVSIPVPLGGGIIRIGNLFNSEILGAPTRKPWGVVFDRVDSVPRHPAQVYEALTYFLIFAGLWALYQKSERARRAPGLFFGLFLVFVYGARFLLEFIKENQVPFEQGMRLNMGQLLSIPAVLAGAALIVRALRVQPYAAPAKRKPGR